MSWGYGNVVVPPDYDFILPPTDENHVGEEIE